LHRSNKGWAPDGTALELPDRLVLDRSLAELELFTENTSCGAEICEERTPLSMWNCVRNILQAYWLLV